MKTFHSVATRYGWKRTYEGFSEDTYEHNSYPKDELHIYSRSWMHSQVGHECFNKCSTKSIPPVALGKTARELDKHLKDFHRKVQKGKQA